MNCARMMLQFHSFQTCQHVCMKPLFIGCTNHYLSTRRGIACIRQVHKQLSSSPNGNVTFTKFHGLAMTVTSCEEHRRSNFGTEASDNSTNESLSLSNPSLQAYLVHLVQEHLDISKKLSEGSLLDAKRQKLLMRRLHELVPIAEKMGQWSSKQAELLDLDELMAGESLTAEDKEMKILAEQERHECVQEIEALDTEIIGLLTPVEPTDNNDIIMEFSAGVGGQEAMLFTSSMFQMYERFAAYMNWEFRRLGYFTTDLGGLRHATVSISGAEAYKLMKHEGGVHRVQRVPKTERSGRIHTSTMTVVVLPQPKEIDLKLNPKDLRIETTKASGAGGQHVNTTDSAVRIVHLPTGTTAESQQQRSQLKNRNIAMTMLQSKIYNSILEKQKSAQKSMRQSQAGTSGRSEKIRTYNFQQDRVTDHRVGRSEFDVEGFLQGEEKLEDMIQMLSEQAEREAILRMVEKFEDGESDSKKQ